LDGQASVSFRFRFETDSNTNFDGWHIDDVDLSYEPYACYYLPPAVPTLVAPPDGTITTTQAITFTWEPGAGGGTAEGYNLLMDGTAVYTTTDTWYALTLPAGPHGWTVRAYNTDGASDYAATWFVTIVETPTTPILLDPPDGTLLTTTHDVTLTWQWGGGSPVEHYDLDLNGAVYPVTGTSYAFTAPAGEYTWTVRGCNVAGCSLYADAWALTVLDAPVTPTLVYPPDGALITTTHDIAFAWQLEAGSPADSYNLEVNGAVYTTTGTVYTLTLPVGPFIWRVQAVNAAGASAYSAPWSGEIADPAGVPELLAPADGTVTTTAALALAWEVGTGGMPDGYNLELDGTVITTTGSIYSATLSLGAHTWRVRAYNAAGYTPYTAAWTVTVQAASYRVFLPVVLK
jgi:hypothetical protein